MKQEGDQEFVLSEEKNVLRRHNWPLKIEGLSKMKKENSLKGFIRMNSLAYYIGQT